MTPWGLTSPGVIPYTQDMKYHTEVYMPKEAERLEFATMLNYSAHARSAAKRDRHGMIDLPKVFDTRKASLIEAVIQDGRVTRALYRMKYDTGLDLSLVILPERSLVVTVWLNKDNDKHRTLDRGQYARR